VLSVALAWRVGIWGVALATLVTDVVALAFIGRVGAPAAGASVRDVAWASLRPVAPAVAAALVVLVGGTRLWTPSTLLELVPLGAAWALAAGLAIWRFGLVPREREQLAQQLRGARGGRAEPAVEV
jgi:hypothetical protein